MRKLLRFDLKKHFKILIDKEVYSQRTIEGVLQGINPNQQILKIAIEKAQKELEASNRIMNNLKRRNQL